MPRCTHRVHDHCGARVPRCVYRFATGNSTCDWVCNALRRVCAFIRNARLAEGTNTVPPHDWSLVPQRGGYPDVQASPGSGAVRLPENGARERRRRDRVPPRKSHLQGERLSALQQSFPPSRPWAMVELVASQEIFRRLGWLAAGLA